MKSYAELEGYLAHSFRNPDLLRQALTHRSYAYERKEPGSDNERLEFLGDAVLDLAVTHLLLEKYPGASEGELSSLRSQMVSEPFLANLALRIGMGAFLRLGKGEEASGGREKASLLADAYEALIGALYTELGFEGTFHLLRRLWEGEWERVSSAELQDFKSIFQEKIQAKLRIHPRYEVLSEQGPPHQRTFDIGVFVGPKLVAQGTGRSKREAEQRAARVALQVLENG